MSKFKLACVQMNVGSDKALNLKRASDLVVKAAKSGAQVVALPEVFNSPYGTQFFAKYAETIPDGETTHALQKMAKGNNVYLIGGSFPEVDLEKLYNTSLVFNPEGEVIAKHRKVHLFDIDVPGKITFKESDVLSGGSNITTFDTKFGRLGLGICYDIRFPELTQLCAKEGCDLVLFPGCFNMTTGPMHWELLQRARATDNQLYVAAISQARDEDAGYVAWGHSTVVDPYGKVVATCDEKETIVYADIDTNKCYEVRQNIPIRNQKRHDIYSGVSLV